MAGRGLSTPAVFRECDRLAAGLDVPEPVASRELLDALAKGDPDALAATVSNDLQPAALSLFPELADTLAAGRAAGALASLVSGSGPTTAFLARDPEAAEHDRADAARVGHLRERARGLGPGAGGDGRRGRGLGRARAPLAGACARLRARATPTRDPGCGFSVVFPLASRRL